MFSHVLATHKKPVKLNQIYENIFLVANDTKQQSGEHDQAKVAFTKWKINDFEEKEIEESEPSPKISFQSRISGIHSGYG